VGQRILRYLFDTGVSREGALRNADLFAVDLHVDGVILSHGHFDHTAGLHSMLARTGSTKLVVHPDAFLRRWLIFPDGTRARMPYIEEGELVQHGAEMVKTERPTFLPTESEPFLLVTGEIPRKTSYEIGFPLQYAETKDGLAHDPLVKDDQALVANVKGKGLVILSGCGHAGIINTITYATVLAETERVHAIVGGFHLTGPTYEAAIDPTLKALSGISPNFLVPCHCTGWKAVNRMAHQFPAQFIQPSVGTTLNFYTD
jgi:7,8-dihydropterin-6-yl-methyl-4-(beta-D-ribofuranosyl)aminobenzene 5'-phosphate synthase